MLLPSGLKSVPRRMLSICEKIVAVTDDVCDRHLNQEYCELARMMTEALCRKRPSPLTSGQPRTWAAGIVYVLGRVNFLIWPDLVLGRKKGKNLKQYGHVI